MVRAIAVGVSPIQRDHSQTRQKTHFSYPHTCGSRSDWLRQPTTRDPDLKQRFEREVEILDLRVILDLDGRWVDRADV